MVILSHKPTAEISYQDDPKNHEHTVILRDPPQKIIKNSEHRVGILW